MTKLNGDDIHGIDVLWCASSTATDRLFEVACLFGTINLPLRQADAVEGETGFE